MHASKLHILSVCWADVSFKSSHSVFISIQLVSLSSKEIWLQYREDEGGDSSTSDVKHSSYSTFFTSFFSTATKNPTQTGLKDITSPSFVVLEQNVTWVGQRKAWLHQGLFFHPPSWEENHLDGLQSSNLHCKQTKKSKYPLLTASRCLPSVSNRREHTPLLWLVKQ